MSKQKNITQRTQQKINYATIHLDELKTMPKSLGRGSELERAHHEAFLSQLFGAFSSLLIELNYYLALGLPEEHLSLGKLHEALKKQGQASMAITDLYKLSKDKESWFCLAKDMRDLSTHVSGIPLAHYANTGGDPRDDKTALKHPRTLQEQDRDALVTLSSWLNEMEKLIDKCRRLTTQGAG